MLIVGARGFAKEVLEVVSQLNELMDLVFYDDVNRNLPAKLYGKFPVLTSLDEASAYFIHTDSRFTLGLGNPYLRKKMYEKFLAAGGQLVSTISPLACIGSFDVQIGEGSNILPGAIFSNGTKIGRGGIVYYHSSITHDCIIGEFVQISPGVTLLGKSEVGSYSQIGANATILPNVKIGQNVIIGAGAVVTKDIPDDCLVTGIPGIIKKKLTPLDIEYDG